MSTKQELAKQAHDLTVEAVEIYEAHPKLIVASVVVVGAVATFYTIQGAYDYAVKNPVKTSVGLIGTIALGIYVMKMVK